jgi:NADH dehydrogenase
MKKVVIIGGGFAGFWAARRLARSRQVKTVLLDQRDSSDFLPLLPDILGNRLNPAHCRFPLSRACLANGIEFVHAAVTEIDLAGSSLRAGGMEIGYDYLLVASGSSTFFHGQDQFRKNAMVLDSVHDAEQICARLKQPEFDHVVVVGGGYTGIEIATQISRRLRRAGMPRPVALVEIAPKILGPMPDDFRAYTQENLDRCGIRVMVETAVEEAGEDAVHLSDGTVFTRPLLLWAAGVTVGEHVQALPVDKTRQGRVTVDDYLRVHGNCYAAGDAANVVHDGKPLRMGVQFSISEGVCAADNILRDINQRQLKPFKPVDLGYVVPMANGRSCGIVLGRRTFGRLPTALHYIMSVYRTHGWRHRLGIVRDLASYLARGRYAAD